MLRVFAFFLGLLSLAACTGSNDFDAPAVELGDFSLAHRVVVAPNLTKGPASREASKEEWISAFKDALSERFDRYEGDRLYHFGVSVEGYVLAQPGIPLVASPKSVVVFKLTVWDDAKGQKLNEEPVQLTALEDLSGNSILGSGLTTSREEQLQNLSRSAAKAIQSYLRRRYSEDGWFQGNPDSPEEELPSNADTQDEGNT